jgi:uncharacterized protein YceK
MKIILVAIVLLSLTGCSTVVTVVDITASTVIRTTVALVDAVTPDLW